MIRLPQKYISNISLTWQQALLKRNYVREHLEHAMPLIIKMVILSSVAKQKGDAETKLGVTDEVCDRRVRSPTIGQAYRYFTQ